MKILSFLLWLLGLASGFEGCSQTIGKAPANPYLAHYIDSLDRNDQRPFELAMRGELRQDSAIVWSHRIYRQNYPQLQRIIREDGYPGFTLVGPEATKHFNNMVLHCFFDVPFQNEVLQLFTQEGQKQPALLADHQFLRTQQQQDVFPSARNRQLKYCKKQDGSIGEYPKQRAGMIRQVCKRCNDQTKYGSIEIYVERFTRIE